MQQHRFGKIKNILTGVVTRQQSEQRQLTLAEALRDSALALTSTLDFEEVLDRILLNVGRVVPNDVANVMLIEGDYARVVRYRGYALYNQEAWLERVRFPIAATPNLHQMVKSGSPLVISDVHNYSDWIIVPEASWIRSYMGVPIHLEGRTIGFLNLDNALTNAFTSTHAKFLQAFADQAAVAIKNARLYEHIDRRQRYLETLHRVNRRTVPERDPQKLMQAVVDGLAEEFGYPIATILMGDADTRRLRMVAMSPNAFDLLGLDMTYTQSYDEGILGWVMRHGKPLMINDTTQDPHYTTGGGTPMMSQLATPIRHEGNIIGTLSLESLEKDAFDELDQEALLELAGDLALKLENLALTERLKEAAAAEERNRLARDLHDTVTQTIWSATLTAEVLPRVWERDPEEGLRRLKMLHQLTRGALAEMRSLLLELRPAALETMPVDTLLDQLATTVTTRLGVPVVLGIEGDASTVPIRVKIALYRVAQEALNNTVKHARASFVMVRLNCESDQIELVIEDDGVGFVVDKIPPGTLGLAIIRERAADINAAVDIDSWVGEGTKITLTWVDS